MLFENPIAEITDYSFHLGEEVPKNLNFLEHIYASYNLCIYSYTIFL